MFGFRRRNRGLLGGILGLPVVQRRRSMLYGYGRPRRRSGGLLGSPLGRLLLIGGATWLGNRVLNQRTNQSGTSFFGGNGGSVGGGSDWGTPDQSNNNQGQSW